MANRRNSGRASNSPKKVRSRLPRERICSAPADLYEGMDFITKCEKMCQHTDPSLVVQEIISDGSELERLISSDRMSQSDIKRLLRLFNQPNFTEETLQTTLEVNAIFCYLLKSEFVTSENNLFKFLAETLDEIESEIDSDKKSQLNLKNIVSLLRNFMNKFPNQHSLYSNCIVLLKDKIESGDFDGLIEPRQKQTIINLHTQLAQITRIPETDENTLSYGDPFRSIDIFPSYEEIQHSRSTELRALVREGEYEDVESYLDIHFKLLREDMIYPIRQGLKFLIKLNENFATNLYTYDHVRIAGISAKKTHGLVYNLTFTPYGVKNIKKYDWKRSDRLRFGSLLCITKKNKKGYPTFKNPLWGVVACQEKDIIGNNQISVRLQNGFESEFQFNTDYFMIESREAYFEAYRHTLSVLQTMDEDNLPFKDIFLGKTCTCGPPAYIDENAVLDFGDLLPLLDNQVRVIEEWPMCEQLNEGQYRALKLAFSSQVALIQGAPGTGKTHVGLTIMKILLETRKTQSESDTPNVKLKESLCDQPFVILTHSNSVLDHVLGLVRSVELNVVRLGSRSQDDNITPHTLFYIRKYVLTGESLPTEIRRLLNKKDEVRKELTRLKKIIEKYGKELQSTKKSAKMSISKEFLKVIASKEHFNSLYGAEESGFKIVLSKKGSLSDIWLRELSRRKTFDEILSRDIKLEKNPFAIIAARDLTLSEGNAVDRYLMEERRVEYLELEEASTQQEADTQQVNKGEEIKPAEGTINEEKIFKVAVENLELAMQETEFEFEIPKSILEVPDLWALNQTDRETLYKYWATKLTHMYSLLLKSYSNMYSAKMEELEVINTSIDLYILKKATVVAMTTTGAAKNSKLIRKLKPRIVLVDEASEVLEAQVIASLCESVEHLILIGDPLMIRPSTAVSRLSTQYNLNLSLFERLIINEFRHATLTLQHRMRPELSSIIQLLYPMISDKLPHTHYQHVQGVSTNTFFISHSCSEDPLKEDCTSRSNVYEAKFIVEFALYLLVQGYRQEDLTILAFYSAQRFLLQDLMKKRLGRNNFRISTVDGFQGEESDIIILSAVRGNVNNIIGHCKVDNRVSVAFSRAKLGFYVIGNENCFRNASRKSKSGLWERVLNRFKEMQCVGDRMQLYCVKHGTVCSVKNAEEFRKVNNKNCFEECENFEPRNMMRICTKSLLCGHPCLGESEQICSKVKCSFQTTKQFPCHHSVTYECNTPEEDVLAMKCEEKCDSKLECGHMCQGLCFLCFNSNSHVTCIEKCSRKLACSHECRGKCHYPLDCPPCPIVVTRSCKHSKTTGVCGEVSTVCTQDCEWRCEHFVCERRCFEVCSRPCCDERCELVLNCGHACLGCCGEVCPRVCRTCRPYDETLRVYFGDEKHPFANFVLLEDCGHIFEALGLDKSVKKNLCENKNAFPRCPKCDVMIVSTERYRHLVNQILVNVEDRKREILAENKRILSQNWAKLRVFLSQNTSLQQILDLLEQVPILQSLKEEITHFNLYILSELLKMLQGLFVQKYPLEVWAEDSPMIQFFYSDQLDSLLHSSHKNSSKNNRKILNELTKIYRKCPIYTAFKLMETGNLELWEVKVFNELKDKFESLETINQNERDKFLTHCEAFLSYLNEKYDFSFPSTKPDTSFRRKWTPFE